MNKLLLFLFVFGYSYTTYASSPEAIENPPIDLFTCDDNNDGVATFNLTINDAIVLGAQNPADFQITYHVSQADATNNTNPIPNPAAFTSMTATLFVRVGEIANNDAFEVGVFDVIVLDLPSANPANDIIDCADNPGINGIPNQNESTFNLTQQNDVITTGEANVEVLYYTSLADAQNVENSMADPSSYTNTSNPQTIYARVVSTESSCISNNIVEFDISVESLPFILLEETCLDTENPTTLDGTVETPVTGASYSYTWTLDGVLFSFEPMITINQEGLYEVSCDVNYQNGISCSYTASANIVNCLIDTDDDGVPDAEEDLNGNGDLEDDDTDDDDIPNYLDDDDDGDLVMTIDEITGIGAGFAPQDFIDTDDDLIENYLDDDDDGDTVLTKDEDYNNSGSPLDDDTNDNGIPDFLDPDVALNVSDFSLTTVSLYPNPTNSVMTIKNIDLGASIIIYDMLGRTVGSFNNDQKNVFTLDVSGLNKGMYFIKIDQRQPISFIKN